MNSFNFEKLYLVGNHLKSHSKAEEYQRSAITRYYYSIFHPVKEYYEKSFRKILSSQNSHGTLITELENSPFEEEQKLGEMMRILRNNRNRADYSKKTINKNLAKNSKKKTDDTKSQLNMLIKHPLRPMKN